MPDMRHEQEINVGAAGDTKAHYIPTLQRRVRQVQPLWAGTHWEEARCESVE
jgi:hypothetical protein